MRYRAAVHDDALEIVTENGPVIGNIPLDNIVWIFYSTHVFSSKPSCCAAAAAHTSAEPAKTAAAHAAAKTASA
jgi:hypothetical protein